MIRKRIRVTTKNLQPRSAEEVANIYRLLAENRSTAPMNTQVDLINGNGILPHGEVFQAPTTLITEGQQDITSEKQEEHHVVGQNKRRKYPGREVSSALLSAFDELAASRKGRKARLVSRELLVMRAAFGVQDPIGLESTSRSKEKK